jgi:hypothetical protein
VFDKCLNQKISMFLLKQHMVTTLRLLWNQVNDKLTENIIFDSIAADYILHPSAKSNAKFRQLRKVLSDHDHTHGILKRHY